MPTLNKPINVLIADDDPMARETFGALLERENYSLHFASSGAETLSITSELLPDLILLDVMMPNLSGIEVCRQIKGNPDYRHIPIILVTALDDTNDIVSGLDAGADEFVSKPVNSLELRARVRSMIRIKQQYDEIQYALQTRDLLSNMIVHDMRNPLAAVLLYIQLLRRKGGIPADQAKYLDMIFNETHHVSSFLEDILLLSKLDRSKLTLTRISLDLSRLLNEIRLKVKPLADARQVTLYVEPQANRSPAVMVDMVLLQRALESLLAHAVKTTPIQTSVVMRVEYPRLTDQTPGTPLLRISIANQCPNVPEGDLDRLFDKFAVMALQQQGKAHIGLGLAYSKMVAEAHGGTVRATNLTPTGLEFIFELQ